MNALGKIALGVWTACTLLCACGAVANAFEQTSSRITADNYESFLKDVESGRIKSSEITSAQLSDLMDLYIFTQDKSVLQFIVSYYNEHDQGDTQPLSTLGTFITSDRATGYFAGHTFYELLALKKLPDSLATAVSKYCRADASGAITLENLIGAAVLFKNAVDSEFAENLLSQGVDSQKVNFKMAAVNLVGLVGDRGRVFVPRLKSLLNDEFQSVKVLAAVSLSRLAGHDEKMLKQILLDSLTAPGEAIVRKPFTISGYLQDHHIVALQWLLRTSVTESEIDNRIVPLLTEAEDSVKQHYCIAVIESNKGFTPAALQALKTALNSPNAFVRKRAETVLKTHFAP